jgi:predicted extracellular nuclease
MRVSLLSAAVAGVLLASSGTAQADVVISQIYGGGGNSGATLKSDFMELHNNGTAAVNLSGWSVQYASATGNSWQTTPLSGSIAPGGYYLIKQADGAGGTVNLPTPDVVGTIAMAGAAAKVALVQGTAALSGTCPTGVVDLVGISTANCAEGTVAPAMNNTLAIVRADGGCTDTGNNATDFVTAAPAPRNSASPVYVCGAAGQVVIGAAAVSQAEGDSGITAFTFTISLNAPAGDAGVSFDYATRDGSATAGSDYIATSGSATIAPGQTSASITVQVNGDTTPEGDETFLLDISNIQGAFPGSLSVTGTIVNDDFATLPISVIQGSGARSPYEGQVVTTRGVVTGVRTAGYFIQTPDDQASQDMTSSRGIYVYTGAAPAANIVPGTLVAVTGTVLEYVPSADPHQLPLTELSSPTTTVLSSGHPLPAPVVLTTSLPSASGPIDQLERYEGMRVTVPSLTVNAPTGGSINETQATGSGNGVFHAVVTGVPRSYREPGIALPDPLPAGAPADVPRWDTNPELLAVSSGAIGAERLNLASNCKVLDVTGPLDYTFRRYTIYPESTPVVDCQGNDQPRAAALPLADDINIATYNLQRFFDDINDPAIGEPVLTSAAYDKRLNKASLAVRDYLHFPDILGAVEVENLNVLTTLANRINADAVANSQPNPQYTAYLMEGNDVGGIDVGFLVKTAEVAAGLPRVAVQQVIQYGKTTTWTEPGGGTSLLNDRPPLLLEAVVNFADGRQYPLTSIVVHNRSLNGNETDDAAGQRVRAKRQAQAEFLANLLQARQVANPDEKVLVMGDFNTFEFNDGYVDAMGTITGQPSRDSETVVPGDGADLVNPDYQALTWSLPADQSYSYTYDGVVQSLDHVLANAALLQDAALENLRVSHARINADFAEAARSDGNTPTRLADHDPTLVLLQLKMEQFADLGIAANADVYAVDADQPVNYTVAVNNAGPAPATQPAVALVFDAVVQPAIGVPAGWACGAPVVTTTITVTCTINTLAAGASSTFSAQVTPGTALAGTTLALAASVQAQTADPSPANNTDAVDVAINAAPAADLAVSLDGPAVVPASGLTTQVAATVRNLGNLAAAAPVLALQGNTLNTTSTVTAPSGWSCAKTTNGNREASFRCTGASLAAGASAQFSIKTPTRPVPAGGLLQVSGQVSSSSADADPANNSDNYSAGY